MTDDYKFNRVKIHITGSRPLSYDELTKISEKIKIEKRAGLYKVMYIQRKETGGFDEKREKIRYQRPQDPIPAGAGCEFCDPDSDKGRVSPLGTKPEDLELHNKYCPIHKLEKLTATIGLFKKTFIDTNVIRSKTNPEYEGLRKRWKSGTLTQEDIEETLLNSVTQKNNKVRVKNNNDLTAIKYIDIKPHSGIDAAKIPNDWPTSVCLYYRNDEGEKAQFRLDSKGNIFVIHIPWEIYKSGSAVKEIVSKIKKVIPDWKTKNTNPTIVDITYTGNLIKHGTIDIETLKKDLFPRTDKYQYLSAPHIKAEYPVKGKAAELTLIGSNNFKIKLSSSPVLSKPNLINIRLYKDEINYTTTISENGYFRIQVSSKEKKGKRATISERKIKFIAEKINGIIEKLIVGKNKKIDTKNKLTTTSGEPLPTRINSKTNVCRGAQKDKPSPQPNPYSFKGKCPEPGQVVFPLEGFEGKDNKWYPCCGKLTKGGKKSEAEYRKLLIEGFPTTKSDGDVPDNPDETDTLSGVLPKDFDKKGTNLKVKIPDEGTGWIDVKMDRPLKNGKFKVTVVENSKNADYNIERADIKPESRHVIGLRETLKQRKKQLSDKYGKREGRQKFNEYIEAFHRNVGKPAPNTKVTKNKNTDLLKTRQFYYLTYNELQKLYNKKYKVTAVPKNSKIVAIYNTSKKNEVAVFDLENHTTELVSDWKNFEGTIIGHSYVKNKINKFLPWKKDTDHGKPPSDWEILDTETLLKDNIIAFCDKKNLKTNNLVFIAPNKKPLIWYDTPQSSKPYIEVQLVGEPTKKNRISTTWNVGFNDSTLNKRILGPKRQNLTITVKNNTGAFIEQLDPEERHFWVTPQYNSSGILDNRKPLSLIAHSPNKKTSEKEFYNTIEQLINKIPEASLKPVKYKNSLAWNIDSKYITFEQNKLKVT